MAGAVGGLLGTRMRSRADYERAIELTGEVIRRWDPFQLIAGGTPKDEFDAEVERIATYIPRVRSEEAMALAISEVFSKAFGPKEFTPSACTDVGTELYGKLLEAGLV